MGSGQGLGGCYTCIKYLMFTFNLLFWILGCTLLGIGIWVRVDPNFAEALEQLPASSSDLYAGSYLLIVVGSIIMILGFLGCCGAIKESQCMLATFFVFLFIIFAVLLAAGIWAATNTGKFQDEIKKNLQASLAKAKNNDQDALEQWKSMQKRSNCCGVTSATDWDLSPSALETCKGESGVTARPCYNALMDFMESNLTIITGVGIGIAVVMIFGMIFSMMLCCAIRDTKA